LAGHPPEGGSKPPRRRGEEHQFGFAVAAGPEIGRQQKPDVPASEPNGQTHRRGVTRVAHDFLQQGKLPALHLRRRQGHGEVVRGQSGRSEEHRAAADWIQPESQQVVRDVDREPVGQRFMPGRECDGISQTLLDSKDRNQRLPALLKVVVSVGGALGRGHGIYELAEGMPEMRRRETIGRQ
jgi:hypothetical protein